MGRNRVVLGSNGERTALNQLRFRTADSTTVQLYLDDVKVTLE